VSDKNCPSESELVRFVDADLSPERLARVEQHLELCGACAKQVTGLSELVSDVVAEVPQPGWDVGEHVDAVMKRLDAPALRSTNGQLAWWGGALAVAAAAALFVTTGGPDVDAPQGELVARGAAAASSLSRDVGVQVYARDAALRPLGSASVIGQRTALTAGLRNLGNQPAYLLLFAVDANHDVHWLAPEFTVASSDPAAVTIAPATAEQLLPSSVVFDDLAAGSLRVVAVITAEPTRVSEVESLGPEQLSDAGLMARFPQAEVRQILLQVKPE
jgi:hypothetical protein